MSRTIINMDLRAFLARLDQLDKEGVVYDFVAERRDDNSLSLELRAESDLPPTKITLTQDDNHNRGFTIAETHDSRPLQPFTVWCRQSNDVGTTWISPVIMARDMAHAGTLALRQCSADWGMGEDNIAVVGVAKGDVEILTWNDL